MATKRVQPRIFTAEDVESHRSPQSCWVTLGRNVYDVTSFLSDHPGGDDLVLNYAGKDIRDIMQDSVQHIHSESAYDILKDLQVGLIGNSESTCNDETVIDEHYKPEYTSEEKDYERNQFLDLKRPLIMQVWNANFSKNFYLQQVHQPRYLPEPARLFGPSYLEMLTRTSWYVVPLFWGPITIYLFRQSLLQQASISSITGEMDYYSTNAIFNTILCFLTGNVIWTILEYTLHRFLFHVDEYLPDRPFFLMLHFLLHGIHHYLPMDRLRLVMPPTLFGALQFPFTRLAYALFPPWMANGIIAGAFAFYMLYDCMHYALHHTKMPQYMKEMKIYHMAHHFKNYELGFGVTSKFWDWVFSTQLRV